MRSQATESKGSEFLGEYACTSIILFLFVGSTHFPGTGVFEASLLSGGEILQPSFIGPRIPTSLENGAFYPHLLPVLLCGAEMSLKEPKHLPQVL